MPKTNKRIAEPLKTLVTLRKQLNLRQKELANKVGCSLDTIKSLEQGRLKLSETLAMKIYEATGIDPAWVAMNDPKKPPITFWKAEPYTRAVFEAIQGGRVSQKDTWWSCRKTLSCVDSANCWQSSMLRNKRVEKPPM